MHATHPRPAVGADTPADTLRAAADYLDRHGWCQGSYYGAKDTDTPPACVVGAIAIVCYGYPNPEPFGESSQEPWAYDRWRLFITAEFMLSQFIGTDGTADTDADDDTPVGLSLHEWNDEPYQSLGAIVAVLRAAADDYERIGGAA